MTFFQRLSNTNGDVTIHLAWLSGATGAIPTTFIRARGVTSVTRTGTGITVVVLDKGYTALLNSSVNVKQASRSTTAAWNAKVTAEDVAGTAKSITIEFTTVAGAVADAANNDVVSATFTLKRTPGLS